MSNNQNRFPHSKKVKQETGKFVTEGRKTYWRTNSIDFVMIPCTEKRFNIINNHPFNRESGIDPEGIEVECLSCKQNYYIFSSKVRR